MESLNNLKPGDYVFYIPENIALLITEEYEDGNYLTCSQAAITKFSKSYRVATQEEIDASIQKKKEFGENAKKIFSQIFKKYIPINNMTDNTNIEVDTSNSFLPRSGYDLDAEIKRIAKVNVDYINYGLPLGFLETTTSRTKHTLRVVKNRLFFIKDKEIREKVITEMGNIMLYSTIADMETYYDLTKLIGICTINKKEG